ncbi:MAG: hypothetical protein LBS97_02585 [Treponema sp.]|nr:hypothetical protein [Treponema sp.]
MKKQFMLLGALALALVLVTMGCKEVTDSVSGGDVTYTVEQEGGSSSVTDSTHIKLSFSAALSSLTTGEINVNNDEGAVTKGTLTGEGAVWRLALASVTTQGNVKVSITKSGVESAVKTVTVYKAGAPADTAVSALDLTALVTAPVKDGAPVTTAINTAQYTGTVAWQTSEGTAFNGSYFAASTVYKALVTLGAKTGYTFDGVTADSFTYSGAIVTNGANSGVITITFPVTAGEGQDTVVNLVSLDGKVTAPVKDAERDTAAINTAQYTGSVTWQTSDGSTFTGSYFAASTVYRALVTLRAETGYTFDGIAENAFTYTGAALVTNEANSGTVTITFPATEAIPRVSALDLTALVTAPEKDASPVTNDIYTTQYTGSVTWQTSGGSTFNGYTFAASTVYKARLTLRAESGYTFDGIAADSFTYTGATLVTNEANSGTVTITFPATEAIPRVSALNLTTLVTAPVKGAEPVTTDISTAQYTGSVTWQTSDGSTFTGQTFAAATVYKALVTLRAESGYTFDGIEADSFTHTGATSVTNAADSGIITITFLATADAVVSDFNLAALVDRPVKDAAPVTEIDGAQYTGSIAWQKSDGSAFTGDAFAAATVYKALVTLSAKPGYTFDGVAANSFYFQYGSNLVTSNNAANSGTVTITFPATADAVVSALDLTALVIAPVKGAAPVTTAIDEAQYTGSVAWQTSEGSAFNGAAFAAATVYRARLTLTAKPGYTFSGVLADSFIYTDATAVNNAAHSGVITVTFPATAYMVGSAVITVGFTDYGEITITGDDGRNVISKSGVFGPTSLHLSAEGYTNVVWYVDDGGNPSSGNDITLNATAYAAQKHSITFTGWANGHRYSSQPIPFTVLN